MKLLYCQNCHDLKKLTRQEWRTCKCKMSGGQYNSDGDTVVVTKSTIVMGAANPDFLQLDRDHPAVRLWMFPQEYYKIERRENPNVSTI